LVARSTWRGRCRLTIHSSRRRFAARLNSGVRAPEPTMSNTTLKQRIVDAIDQFERAQLSLVALRSAVVDNGQALEAMPYPLIKEIDDIEYKLTLSQWYDEEGCEVSPEEALSALKSWLSRVPD